MSYGKVQKIERAQVSFDGMHEVVGSIPISSIDVSYAEFDTYEYLPCGSAAVTPVVKRVVLLFLKGD
jgi:hypothetical protein